MVIAYNNTPCQSSLEVEVPRQTSWHTPQGSHSATIRSVKLIHRPGASSNSQIVRITFTVHAPHSQLDYLAKLDLKLDLREGSDLWNVVCNLINRQALQSCSGQTFDLERLVGLPCDIAIEHILDRAEDYAFPLVVVVGVREEGGLIKTASKEIAGKTKDTASES